MKVKVTFSHDYVEIFTEHRVFVYDVTSFLTRIDAVDYAIARHKEIHPNYKILSVQYTSHRHYSV